MWALLVLVLVSTASLPGYTYGEPQYPSGNYIKESCEKNGGPSSFNNLREAMDEFQRDIASKARVEPLVQMLRGERPDDVRTFCSLKSTMKTGFLNVATALRPCLEYEDTEKLDRASEIADSLLSYVCFNDGEKAISFNNGGAQCARNTNILRCASTLFSDSTTTLPFSDMAKKYLSELINGKHDSYELFKKERKQQKKRHECQALVDFKTCVRNELFECPTSSSTFLTGLIDSIYRPYCQ